MRQGTALRRIRKITRECAIRGDSFAHRVRSTQAHENFTPHESDADMKQLKAKNELSPQQREEILGTLKVRFEKNKSRHPGIEWVNIKARLEAHTDDVNAVAYLDESGNILLSGSDDCTIKVRES